MKTKRELIAEYHRTPTPMGVFQIRDKETGTSWLAAGVNMPALWNRYVFQLDLGAHPNAELQAAWKAFGADRFIYEVVSELEPIEGERDDRAEVDALFAMVCEQHPEARRMER